MDNLLNKEVMLYSLVILVLLLMAKLTGASILLIAAPLIIAFCSYRQGWLVAVLLLADFLLFQFLLSSFQLNLSFQPYTVLAAAGVTMGYKIKQKQFEESLLYAIVTAIFALLILLVSSKYIFNLDLIALIIKEVKAVDIPLSILEDNGFATSELGLQQLKNLIVEIIPAMIVMVISIYTFVLYWLFNFMMKMVDKQYKAKPISQFYLPERPILGTAIILLVAFIATTITDNGVFVSNVLYLVMLLFAFNGVALIFFVLERGRWNAFLRVVAAIFLIAFLQLIGLSIVGWVDEAFGLRRKAVKRG